MRQSKLLLGRHLAWLCTEIPNKEMQANMEKILRKYRESDLYLSCCRNTLGRKYIVKTLSTNLIGGGRREKSVIIHGVSFLRFWNVFGEVTLKIQTSWNLHINMGRYRWKRNHMTNKNFLLSVEDIPQAEIQTFAR